MTLPLPQPDVTLSGAVVGSQIIAQWPPRGYGRSIKRLVVVGPNASTFDVYVGMITDTCRRAHTDRGDSNEANFGHPVPVPAGQVVYFVWSGYSVASNATVTIGYDRD